MLGLCWPLLAPFAFFSRVLPCLTFGTMRIVLLPCGHVWGLTMRKGAPCGLERACSSFNVLIRQNYVPRPIKCHIGLYLLVLLGWGMVFVCFVWLFVVCCVVSLAFLSPF